MIRNYTQWLILFDECVKVHIFVQVIINNYLWKKSTLKFRNSIHYFWKKNMIKLIVVFICVAHIAASLNPKNEIYKDCGLCCCLLMFFGLSSKKFNIYTKAPSLVALSMWQYPIVIVCLAYFNAARITHLILIFCQV